MCCYYLRFVLQQSVLWKVEKKRNFSGAKIREGEKEIIWQGWGEVFESQSKCKITKQFN